MHLVTPRYLRNNTPMKSMIPAWVDGTLQPVEKLLAHQKGYRHLAVSVFVCWGDQLLLQRRADAKYHTPGLWANACCTHPHWGENPLETAHRRLDQEIGVKDLKLTHKGQVEYRADVGAGLIEREVVEVYVATVKGPVETHLNPEEVSAVRWVSLADLQAEIVLSPEVFTPWLRIYLSEHLDLILGDLEV